jgi:hypothetical protein
MTLIRDTVLHTTFTKGGHPFKYTAVERFFVMFMVRTKVTLNLSFLALQCFLGPCIPLGTTDLAVCEATSFIASSQLSLAPSSRCFHI